MKVLIILVFIASLISCQSSVQNQDKFYSTRDYWPTDKWKVSSPSEQGLSNDTLKKMYNLFGQAGTIVIVRNGYIVSENYPAPFDTNYLHHIHSCTKSITSIIAGIAISAGIMNIDSSVLSYFPDYQFKNITTQKQAIKIKHILSMSDGLDWKDGIGGKDLLAMLDQPDWTQFYLDKPMTFQPGSHFNYSCGASQLLLTIIQRSQGIKAEEYAKIKIFNPLGIKNYKWDYEHSFKGVTPGAWGLYLTVRDMAKLGYLYLNNGTWDSAQIVSKEWVKESTSEQISRGVNNDAYGYQWWILNGYPVYAYTARGWYGNHYAFITIVPSYDLVVAIAGDIPNSQASDIIKKYVLKSIMKEK